MGRTGLALAGALAAVLAGAGCGYHLTGRGSFLPERIKVIGIPPFDSTVPRALVAERITAAVTKEFIARGGYKIQPTAESAHAALSGTIMGMVQTPIAFDTDGRATRALMTITARVQLRDLRENTMLYDNPGFQFRTELDLSRASADFFETETEGIEQIARDFARSLVATIVEGF